MFLILALGIGMGKIYFVDEDFTLLAPQRMTQYGCTQTYERAIDPR